MTYPHVIGEYDTVAKITKGFSIARFGDGELKILDGKGYRREPKPMIPLMEELRRVIRNPHPKCLVGIPTMDPKGEKYEGFSRHMERFCKYVNAEDGNTYYSSLITRPDSGIAMETRAYYEHLIKIWAKKRRVVVVSEPTSKLLTHVRLSHPNVIHIECPSHFAYGEIDRLQRQTIMERPDIALLSVGVTATALAYRLTLAGIHAVDMGSVGGFLMRWRSGEPKPQAGGEYSKERANES